ncbi:hypothetical protein CRU94_04060 [Arcobacter sp. AHV-9/2010]|uniref:hypothetical protein n=1 Tax=Arcobacter sp. AHV-9/2010 TaxID=2021861 RepID=UPI00100A4607|nr:hypothetical protein [Arcobacter sp. CECT 9299]RXJ95797.1 hypothetical protein CRU94_04060 [Arcobacter sp. CECT 9299]
MQEIEILNKRVDNLIQKYSQILLEKKALEAKISELTNENDKLERYNQDMILKIDTLLKKAKLDGK